MVMYRANRVLKRAPGIKLDMRAALYQVIAILSRYGGSLWLADPAYTFTGSDGTGAAGDNSDTGYVRDLCASYGPELITNGDFSQGTTGWILQQPTSGSVSIAGGIASIISTDGSNAYLQAAGAPLTVGKVYELSCDYATTVGSLSLRDSSGTIIKVLSAGKNMLQFVAATTSVRFNRDGACNCTIDNVSVREVIGRPLFQATTGFKPKLKRVPKRLGPELVTNGSFDTDTNDWSLASGSGGTFSWASGALSVNRTGGTTSAAQSVALVIGRSYAVSASQRVSVSGAGVAPNIALRVGSSASDTPLVSGTATTQATFTANSFIYQASATGAAWLHLIAGVAAGTVEFDNVSVREVLEWGWAWVFDGADDLLATVAQPSVAAETLIVAKQVNATPAIGGAAITRGPSPANTGSLLYANSSSVTAMRIGTGSALSYLSANNPILIPIVQSGVFAAQSKHRINGVQSAVNNGGFASNAMPINVGGYSSLYVGQHIYAAAYTPTAIPDAELLIIERAMAQLAGVTI